VSRRRHIFSAPADAPVIARDVIADHTIA